MYFRQFKANDWYLLIVDITSEKLYITTKLLLSNQIFLLKGVLWVYINYLKVQCEKKKKNQFSGAFFYFGQFFLIFDNYS